MIKSHFYDPLYDYVTFEEAESGGLKTFRAGFGNRVGTTQKRQTKQILPFLETFEVNRLNFLRQSGLAFLVYPSATHTRFAHSIGSCYLGFMACEMITMQAETQIKVRSKFQTKVETMYLSTWLEKRGWREEFLLALLLHDLGHFPFSHTLESNLDFWECFPYPISHEEVTCELLQGDSNSEVFKRYKKYIESRIDVKKAAQYNCKFVSELISKERRRGIDVNALCYLISGEAKYINRIDKADHLYLKLAHHLVSGLLDLDRVDHYRRDSYYTGLKFGSNLNFAGLLGGMTLHYYVDELRQEDVRFELRLSSGAIGHALTLLHSKERLVHDCFEHPSNVSYDSMLHRAINLYVGINDSKGNKLTRQQIDKAYELFFLTDDELLFKLMSEGNDKVKEIIVRIQNRKPFIYLGKGIVKHKKNSLRILREKLIENTKLSYDDIIFKAAKHYASTKVPTDEWLHLHYLFDDKGNNLIEDRDYEEQIRYFERIQDHGRNLVWFFTPDPSKSEILDNALKLLVEKYVK